MSKSSFQPSSLEPFRALSSLGLRRYPRRERDPLQAWDAADELLLREAQGIKPGARLLILHDAFGALSVALREFDPTVVTDSYVSARGIAANLQENPGSGAPQLLGPLVEWQPPTQHKWDWVLIRIPKNQSYFEDLLHRLSFQLHSESRVICGVMVKHQSKRSFELLQSIIGPTHTSLAEKKARLIFAKPERTPTPSPHPRTVLMEGFTSPFIQHSNLFSREKLDIGSRFFLENLPSGIQGTILDLGCANGIIGIRAQEQNLRAEIHFADESQMAIESAKANYSRFFPENRAIFHWTNCFENGAPGTFEWVLCNPPFHQENRVGDFIAKQMFHDSHRVLKVGGTLRVIGNRHLDYPSVLKRLFKKVQPVAANSKFVILDAVK